MNDIKDKIRYSVRLLRVEEQIKEKPKFSKLCHARVKLHAEATQYCK